MLDSMTQDKTGWGWCICDHQGRFMLASSNTIQGRLNTIEGEALAIKNAIIEMIQKGFSHVIIESDSQIAIEAISSTHQGSLEFSAIISNIKFLLLVVSNFEVKFVKWQANMVALTLVRATYSKTSRCVFELIPHCIEQFFINDMN
jgi:ribonuclease HI